MPGCIKDVLGCEVIHASMTRKFSCNRVCGRVMPGLPAHLVLELHGVTVHAGQITSVYQAKRHSTCRKFYQKLFNRTVCICSLNMV